MRQQLTRMACIAATVLVSSQAASLAYDLKQGENTLSRPRIGLALGGGGARGAAHIGVLRVFEQEHIPIDFITGTSVGAVIGGLYAAGVPLSQIQKMFEDKSLMHAYNRVPIPWSVAYSPLTLIPRMVGIYHFVGLYKGDRFAKFLEDSLPANRTNIESTIIPFKAISTDLLSGQSYAIAHGPLGKAIQASSAIPWLKQPVLLQGKLLCDGFLCGANLPIAELRAMGADVVLCVDIDGPPKTVSTKELRHIRSFRHRTNNIMIAKMDEAAAAKADFLLRPDVCDIGILSTSSDSIAKGILAGESAARRALPQIRKLAHIGSLQSTYAGTSADRKSIDPSY